jgi:predicted RND superfamily exporter protein
MIRDRLGRTIDFVTNHNRLTLLVMLVLTAVVLAGVPQVDLGSEAGGTSDQFENVDRVETANYIEEAYGNTSEEDSNRTVQAVYIRQDDRDVLSKESLLAGLEYQQEIKSNDSVQAALHPDGVSGIENIVARQAAGDENATLDEQIRALENTSAGDVERLIEGVVADDPRAQQFLPADHDGTASSTDRRMVVAFDSESGPDTLSGANAAIYDTAAEYSSDGLFVLNSDAWEEYRAHFSGEMLELVLPIALLLILTILVFAYRDIVDVVLGMSGVVLSVLWMFGLLGWLDVGAGLITVVPVVLITGLSIDFGFHVFNRYREERGPGDGIRSPMNRGVRLVSTALVLVTVTASIGFLANLANPLPVIRDLGVSITLGVISALVIFVTVVPALKISIDGVLERIGLDRRKGALGHGTYLRPVLEQSVTLARKAAPVVLVVALVVGTAGGLAWTSLDEESFQQSDGDVADWKQQLPGPLGWETGDVPAQTDHVDETYQPADEDAAIQSRILVEGNVTSNSTLADIDQGVQAIGDEGLLVDHAGARTERSPLTTMERVAEENETFAAMFQNADTNGDGIPDQNIEALYDGLYAADSQTAERVVERTDGEYRSVLVTLSLDAEFSEASAATETLDEGATLMEGDGERTATAAGSLEVQTAILDQIIDGILLTMVIALVAIALAMMAIFRYMHDSATLGAVVAVPIVLVVGLVIGGMFLLGIPLTLLTALLMSLVIGLGVDYNIHVGDRFADELDAGATPVEALRAAVTGTGGALLGSTLTSAGAFATIALVPHPQLQSFGAIVVIALVTAFVVSLVVVPSLLLLWSRYSLDTTTVSDSTDDPLPQD